MRRAAAAALVAAALQARAGRAAYSAYRTEAWRRYPGYRGAFNGEAVDGTLEVAAGATASDLVLRGSLANLPSGTGNGLHIHEGFDTSDAATVGGHFFPGLAADPWTTVTYDGPAAAVSVSVEGVAWRETLGRVVVLHDASGARVAIAKLVPRAPGTIYAASLATYPKYTSLVASVGSYPGTASGVTGTIWVTARSGGGLTLTYDLAGLGANDTEGGLHIHEGQGEDACDDHQNVLGHLWRPASDPDPWTATNYAKAAGTSSAVGSVDVADTGYLLGANEYHAVVVHRQDGGRIACGLLHSNAKATIGRYPGSTDAGPAVSGTVWVAQGAESSTDLVLAYKIDNLPSGETSGGLHIHNGKTCARADDVGVHFWTPAASPDPWTATTWNKAAGNTSASGKFVLGSNYSLAENADHAIVVHSQAGGRIGCGTLQYYPSVQGYVVLSDSLRLQGNLGGVMVEAGASAGVHVHAGRSCEDVAGADSPGGHLLNTDNSDPWTTGYEVNGQVSAPPGGQDYNASTRMSGSSYVDVSVIGDGQTLAAADGRTVVVHSPNGVRIACGVVRATETTAEAAAISAAFSAGLRAVTASLVVMAAALR